MTVNLKAVELNGYLKGWADVNEKPADTSCFFELIPLPESDFPWLHHCVTGQLELPKGISLKESAEPEQLLASALAKWCFFEIPLVEREKATLLVQEAEGRDWRVKKMVDSFSKAFGFFRFIEVEQTEFPPDPKTGRYPFVALHWQEYVLVAEDRTQWFLHFGVTD